MLSKQDSIQREQLVSPKYLSLEGHQVPYYLRSQTSVVWKIINTITPTEIHYRNSC